MFSEVHGIQQSTSLIDSKAVDSITFFSLMTDKIFRMFDDLIFRTGIVKYKYNRNSKTSGDINKIIW